MTFFYCTSPRRDLFSNVHLYLCPFLKAVFLSNRDFPFFFLALRTGPRGHPPGPSCEIFLSVPSHNPRGFIKFSPPLPLAWPFSVHPPLLVTFGSLIGPETPFPLPWTGAPSIPAAFPLPCSSSLPLFFSLRSSRTAPPRATFSAHALPSPSAFFLLLPRDVDLAEGRWSGVRTQTHRTFPLCRLLFFSLSFLSL